MHNGKVIKKLDGGNCRTANIFYTARYKLHGDIYTGNTEEELTETNSSVLLGTKGPAGLSKELKRYRHELYEAFADVTA